MDKLLSKAGTTLVTFAVRSGVQLASSYVLKSVSKLVEGVPEKDRKRVERLKIRLQNRIDIVTHAIELIRLIAARGNTQMEGTISLADELKSEIDDFHDYIEDLSGSRSLDKETIVSIEQSMKTLLSKINQTIPIINLALTTSGARLNGDMNSLVSPGQLLISAAIIHDSNEIYFETTKSNNNKDVYIQVGPSFDMTTYDIFYSASGSGPGKSKGNIIWKEHYARSTARIMRYVNKNFEYSYVLLIDENFDDDRYHDEEVDKRGNIRVDLRAICKIFFSASGRLLKLEDRSSPVLVLKIRKASTELIDKEINSNMDMNTDENVEKLGKKAGNNINWLAFGCYESADSGGISDGGEESDYSDECSGGSHNGTGVSGVDLGHDTKMENLGLHNPVKYCKKASIREVGAISKSLSLMEYLLRLCALQANDQQSVFQLKDERLRLYLNDENTLRSGKNVVAIHRLESNFENLTLNDGVAAKSASYKVSSKIKQNEELNQEKRK